MIGMGDFKTLAKDWVCIYGFLERSGAMAHFARYTRLARARSTRGSNLTIPATVLIKVGAEWDLNP